MTEIEPKPTPEAPPIATKKQSKVKKTLRESCAFTLWLYLIVKVFVFDFDVYLVETYLPSFSWIVRFKFLVYLVLISVYWLSVGDKNFFKTIGYILIYPFIFIWRLLTVLFRSWFLVFTTLSFAISFFRSFKINVVTFTTILVASVLILLTNQKILITFCSITLSLYLLWHFAKRFYYSFVPARALFLPKDTLVAILDKTKDQFKLPDEIRLISADKYTTDQKNKWATNLQFLIILNKATQFAASKLKELQERRIVILYFIFALLFSFFVTVIVFALNNYALHKIEPASFSNTAARSFFFFLYYSFNTILTNGIPDFYPVSTVARLLNTAEIFFGFFLLIILFFVYTNVRSDRTKNEIDSLITSLDKQGSDLESFVAQEFSMDINQALSEIEKLPGNFIKVIYYFTTKK